MASEKLYRNTLSIKLRLIIMSTNLEYRATERQRVEVVQNNGKESFAFSPG